MGEPETVIRVDNLSKRYFINHAEEQGRYTTLRDAIAKGMRSLADRMLGRRRVESTHEEFWALRDVSFEVKRGEVVGIIGRNGAGKSTLLKILARITEPTGGRVEIEGRVASLLEVGTGFHPELTGRDNIYLNGAILGMTRVEIRRKFDEIVAFAEIAKFLDTPVKHYSSGMYMRLAFAVAAHLEPEILIVDEVLAVGDVAFQKKCLGKMGEVARGGRTVLFVSHHLGAIRTLCSMGCVLTNGELAFKGPIDPCLDHYARETNANDRIRFEAVASPAEKVCWIRRAEVASGNAGQLGMGSRLIIRVEVVFARPTRSPRIGFVLSTLGGDPILNANNTYQPFRDPPVPSSAGVFTCDCGEVPMMPGRYSLALWAGDILGDHDVQVDCLRFEVQERDVWVPGKYPPRNAGPLYWRTQFGYTPLENGETDGARAI